MQQLESDGYSFPICSKVIEALHKRQETFHIQTLFVLGHNTKRDSLGNTCPIFTGFVVSFLLYHSYLEE